MAKLSIIETGGKQYKVASGDVISIEIMKGVSKGQKIIFDKVLMEGDEKSLKIGTPYILGAKVEGEVIEEGRGKKIIIQKFKSKVRFRKKAGHRQPYLKVKII